MKKKFLKILALSSLMITGVGVIGSDYFNEFDRTMVADATTKYFTSTLYNAESFTGNYPSTTKPINSADGTTTEESVSIISNKITNGSKNSGTKGLLFNGDTSSSGRYYGFSFPKTYKLESISLTISGATGRIVSLAKEAHTATTADLDSYSIAGSSAKNKDVSFDFSAAPLSINDNEYYYLNAHNTLSISKIELRLSKEVVDTKYAVTFNNADGTQLTTTEVEENGKVTNVPSIDVPRGKTFDGWSYTDATGTHIISSNDIKNRAVTENITYTAAWTTLDSYTVKFFNDDGITQLTNKVNSDGTQSESKVYDLYYSNETVEIPYVEILETEVLKGWKLKADPSDTDIDPNKIYTSEEVIAYSYTKDGVYNFVADIERAKTYTITFDFNDGGATSSVTKTVNEGHPIILDSTTDSTIITPTREGYRFDGWYLGETQIDIETYNEFTKNETLTAKWVKQITVNFEANLAGVVNPASITFDIDTALNNKLPTLTSTTGETFLGWYDENGTEVTSATKFASDTKLTAKWNYVRSSEANAKLGISGIGTAEKLIQYVGYREMVSIDEILPTEVGQKGKSFTLANNAATDYIIGNFHYNSGTSNGYYGHSTPTKDSGYIKDTNVLEMQFELVDASTNTYAIFIPQNASDKESGPVYLVANSTTRLEFTTTINTTNLNHLWTVTSETDGIKIASNGVDNNSLYYRDSNGRFNLYPKKTGDVLPRVYVQEMYDKGEKEVGYSFDNSRAMLQFKADVSKKYIDLFKDKPTEVLGTLKVGITINGETRNKTHSFTYNSISAKLNPSSADSNFYEIVYVLTDISGENLYNAKISVEFTFDGNTATREISVNDLTNLYNSNPESYGLDETQKTIVSDYSNYITNLKSGN